MLNHKQQLEKANQEIEKLKNKVAENHWRLGYHVASQAIGLMIQTASVTLTVSIIYFINITLTRQNGDRCTGDM
ncbi:hypothetical protein [Halalkalibacter akibai]|uniref:Uncharacterized protein n=1 Tax=Halalkalibacter akibai (strain ATCC 43226 / DSM 21942 / CIP 109018 / JCM 9157 / 1139) TaxID=1236973 RepID=W4QYQ9_HALA3|nr:hypothetical protein [Halalkalibacter akibai]GAE37285.1 hypothetical protein JCM9157_4558 [Halalkalibacter akibai JCM 9157]